MRGAIMFVVVPRIRWHDEIPRLRRLAECDVTQTPDEAIKDVKQLAVTVMHLGSMEEWQELIDVLGEPYLRWTLRESPDLLFTEKVWKYWHRRLNGFHMPVPPLPKRSLTSS